MAKAKILIVEDESTIAMGIENTLKGLGYDIAGVVSSGEEAIKKAEETTPDLILMDIVLRGKMDGVEAAEQIRVRLGIPVVYLTAYGDDQTLQRAKITNPFGFLLKPFEERELNGSIEVALYRHEMEKRLKKLTEEWQVTFDSIEEFVSIHNRDFKLVKVNRRFAEALGCKAKDLVGKICYEMVHGTKEPHPHCPHKRTLETGKPSKEEIFEPRLGLHLEISTSPLLDEKGEITGTIHITKDISDRKRTEEILRESEELFRDLYEDAPLGYHEIDAEGIITRVNRMELRMLGWTAEQMIGQPVWKFTSNEGEDRESVKAKLGGSLQPGRAFERMYRRKDGTTFPVLVEDRLLEDKDGRIRGLRATIQDITERKRVEEELSESKQVLEKVTQGIKEGILLISNDFKILWANKTVAEQADSKIEEIIGNHCYRVTHHLESPCDYPLDPCPIRELVKTGKSTAFTHTHFDKEGNKLLVEVSADPIMDEKGEIAQFVHVCRDITERKRLEGQMAQAQKLEAVGQLAAGIAHEINTPIQYVGDNTRFLQDVFGDLNRLLGKHERLLQTVKAGTISGDIIQEVEDTAKEVDLGYLSGEIPKAIQQTLEGVERVAKIVRAMKEFSHPGTEVKSAIDINKAIESTITVSRNEWKYVAEMVTELDPFLPLVPCLPGEVNQVLLNMIINAAHAIADVVGDGSAKKGMIRVSTRRDGEWAEIRVTDTGSGIPEQIRTRIFDPFFTTKKVGKGTGQGLTISHSVIVGKHGGTILFETEIGKGTTFIIRLPLGEERAARVNEHEH